MLFRRFMYSNMLPLPDVKPYKKYDGIFKFAIKSKNSLFIAHWRVIDNINIKAYI